MSVNSNKKVIRKSYSDIRLQQMKPMVVPIASRGIPSLGEWNLARKQTSNGGEVSYVHSAKQTVRKSACDSKKPAVQSSSTKKLSARNCQAKSSDSTLLARKSGSYNKAREVNCEGQAKVSSSDVSLLARRKPKSSSKPKVTKSKSSDKQPMQSENKSAQHHREAAPAESTVGTSKITDSIKQPHQCIQTLANQATNCPQSLAELAQKIISSSNVSVNNISSNVAPRAVENINVISNRKWNTDLDYDWFNNYSMPDLSELKSNPKEFEKWQRGEIKDCPETCLNQSLFQEVFVVVDRNGKSRFVDTVEEKTEKRSTFGSVIMGVMKNLFGMHDYLQANSVWVM